MWQLILNTLGDGRGFLAKHKIADGVEGELNQNKECFAFMVKAISRLGNRVG
jgi:hypothetical protein